MRQGAAASETENDSVVEKKGKNQRKREAQRSRGFGVELTKLSKKEVDMVISLADLDTELAPAIALAKVMARDDGRRRQMNFIGGLLRGTDPVLVETAIKAAKDGNLGGYTPPRPLGDAAGREGGRMVEVAGALEGGEDGMEDGDERSVQAQPLQEEQSKGEGSERVQRWMEGLLCSCSEVQSEVYSLIHETSLDRQDLRRLLRTAQQELAETSQAVREVDNEADTSDPPRSQGSSGAGASPKRNTGRGRQQLAEFLMHLEKEEEGLPKDHDMHVI